MVEIRIAYQGQLRCQATHAPSGTVLNTDAPVDNMGRGESFSPTDLVATGLGTCILTILGIVAGKRGLDLRAAAVTVRKEMVADPVRRIGRLTVEVRIPAELPEVDRRALEAAAAACPVRQSLHPSVEVPIHFLWGK
jgi:putative redox protein